jgi:hypothetical protein
MAQVELKEVFSNLKIIREQDGGKKAVYKFSGPFQEMNDIRGTKNKNGRIYNKKLWERVFGDAGVTERLSSRRMLGELDHPTDDGQIRRTSHIVTEAHPDWNEGVIYGTLELLNHDQGDAALIRALVEQGVQLCVSSRGFGEFMKDGCTIDPETYKLVTWDIVLDPSVPIATLKRVAESVNQNLPLESRARANFIETLAGSNKETKSETKTIQEDSMDEKIVSLMEKNGELQATNAKNEANLNNMKELLTNKNERISVLENANKSLTEKSAKLEETGVALTKANETVTGLQKQLKEYEEIEDRAIKVIESLKAKLEHADELSEKAADTIEELMTKVKERKTNETDDADKADKDVDVKGTLRNWEPDPTKGDELEQLKGLVKTMEAKKKKHEDADADAKAAADKAAADKKAADEKKKHEAEGSDDDDDDKEKGKTNENDDEDDDDKPYEPTAKEKKEARVNMLKNLSEQTVRDGAPKKL